jgi:hypothetical protein
MLNNVLPELWAADPICLLGGCVGKVPISNFMHSAASIIKLLTNQCMYTGNALRIVV